MSRDIKLPKEALIQYFELDLDNCLLTRKDFCNIITKIINDPKEINSLIDELIIWANDRRENGGFHNKVIEDKNDLLLYWLNS